MIKIGEMTLVNWYRYLGFFEFVLLLMFVSKNSSNRMCLFCALQFRKFFAWILETISC